MAFCEKCGIKVYQKNDVIYNDDSIDGTETVEFTVDDCDGFATEQQIQDLSNSLLRLAFAAWENLLYSQPLMSLNNIGFTSYDL